MDDPVVELAGVALDAQDELRSALVELLEVEGLDPAAVRRHEAARLARDEAALALGLAVLRTLRSGAEVRLVVEVEPSTAVEVEELPEEEAPEEEAPEEEEPEDEDLATEEVGRQPPDLSLFKRQFGVPRFETPAAQRLTAAVLGELARLGTSTTADELLALRALVDRVELWIASGVPHEVEAALHLLTARLRFLQAEPGRLSDAEGAQVTRLIRRLGAIVQEDRAFYIHGLALWHQPKEGSWLADARRWAAELGVAPPAPEEALARLREELESGELDDAQIPGRFQAVVDGGMRSNHPELLDLALPHIELIRKSGCCKTLLKRLKDKDRKEEALEEALGAGPRELAVEPEVLARTQGRRAVILGGDERSDARQRIQQAFGFASVEWERGWEVRRARALAERIRGGSVDCLIVLRRFISHKLVEQVNPAAREAGVLTAWVPQGYGVRGVEGSLAQAMGLPGAPR